MTVARAEIGVRVLLACAAIALPGALVAGEAAAQHPMFVPAGGSAERELRTRQLVGQVRPHQWSLRGFGPRELERFREDLRRATADDSTGDSSGGARLGRARVARVPASAAIHYNSAFPFGLNDGPVWQGRGVTAVAQFGAQAQWGAMSATLAPVAYWAQNAAFPLLANGLDGEGAFANASNPNSVDLPQRFGARPLAAVQPGESELRIDSGIAVGLATSSQWWGPMAEFPYVLGNNAGGFPRAFLGTARPLDLRVVRVHARIVYGRLEQSRFSRAAAGDEVRFAPGAVLVIEPRFLPGLEVGVSRFYHIPWPDSGLGAHELRRPLETFIKSALPVERRGADAPDARENQLASLFGRWVIPAAGVEVYGEYGREDHNWDRRDLILQPDHSRSYGLGIARAWEGPRRHLSEIRAELINYQVPFNALHRFEGGIYGHNMVVQGHTHRGQLLGSGLSVGSGAGGHVGYTRHEAGRTTKLGWYRLTSRDNYNPVVPDTVRSHDKVSVQHVLSAERTTPFRGMVLRTGITAVYEFNRRPSEDAFNLGLTVGVDW